MLELLGAAALEPDDLLFLREDPGAEGAGEAVDVVPVLLSLDLGILGDTAAGARQVAGLTLLIELGLQLRDTTLEPLGSLAEP